MAKKVNILLSTYNGEKYIEEQLESVFTQTYSNIYLYIRDDGSTDATVEKIRQYLKKFPERASRTRWIPNETNENIGYMQSFWKLLELASGADYYAFCDQDDVWLPEKVESGVKRLECEGQENLDLPLLYFSNFYQCNQDLSDKREGRIYLEPIEFENVLFYTPAFGFTILINENLRQLVLRKFNHDGLPHDGWIQKVAAAFGKIFYDPRCMAYYRRHENAVTVSNANKGSLAKNWIRNEIIGASMQKTHDVLVRFFQIYGDEMKDQDRKKLEIYATRKRNLAIWLRRVGFREHLRPSVGGRMALRICFFLGRY